MGFGRNNNTRREGKGGGNLIRNYPGRDRAYGCQISINNLRNKGQSKVRKLKFYLHRIGRYKKIVVTSLLNMVVTKLIE